MNNSDSSNFSTDPFDFVEVHRQSSDMGSPPKPEGNLNQTLTVQSTNTRSTVVVPLPDSAFHPNDSAKLPLTQMGGKLRRFQPSWCLQWPWIHYDQKKDSVLCHTCASVENDGQLKTSCKDNAFLKTGYRNWKKATDGFKKHQLSACHKMAIQVIAERTTIKDVGEIISSESTKARKNNRAMLLKILSTVRFLGRQGLSLRGDYLKSDECEANSNFIQTLKLRGLDDPALLTWIGQARNDKYTSPSIQNEMLHIMSLKILRDIASDIGSNNFVIMLDESTDISNIEQLVVCFRWVDCALEAHEQFVGLYALDNIQADHIVHVLEDCLLRMQLNLSSCRGQTYDGASNMSGKRSGVAAQIEKKEKRAIYLHCYAHSLNLACQDSIRKCKVMDDCLDMTYEITKLIKQSPRRDRIFEKMKAEITPGAPAVRMLCATRWTVRAKAFRSVIENYAVLQNCLEEVLLITKNSEMKTRINGAVHRMTTFDYFFGVHLGSTFLGHCDNLATALQGTQVSAAEGHRMARNTVQLLNNQRSEVSFERFWLKVEECRASVAVTEPFLSRKRKRPARFELGDAEPEFHENVKAHYRQIYNEFIDRLIMGISDRFDQPGYAVYEQLHELLLESTKDENPSLDTADTLDESISKVSELYADDIDMCRLKDQLLMLRSILPTDLRHSTDVMELIKYVKNLDSSMKCLLCEVVALVKLILVLPATNAVSERSFSALRRIKTYMRSTMSQKRLNHCMLLNVHSEKTDKLDLVWLANEFVKPVENRFGNFGRFTSADTV